MSDNEEVREIRARHEAGERASAVDDREWLLDEVERLRAVALVMIERMVAKGIYFQESIHATAAAAIKDLWGEGDGR